MKKKFLGRLLTMLLVAAMVFTLLPASAIAAAEWWGGDESDSVTYAADKALDYRIVHLDCGRKYFSVQNVRNLIDAMVTAGYNQLELAFGNAGLRFLLDDMSIKVSDTVSYDDKMVRDAIVEGNENQNSSNDGSYWTEADMTEILSYAEEKDVDIVPLLNMPGHMNAILDGEVFHQYRMSGRNKNGETTTSLTSINLSNAEAVAFGKAFLQKYVDWFKGKVTYFNFGADEVANDIVNPFYSYNNGYSDCVAYINACAEIIANADITPRAFNDYIYFNGSSSTIDSRIEVCYWNNQWSDSPYVSAKTIAAKGHKMINTNSEWYYVVGRTSDNNLSNALSGVDSYSYNKFFVQGQNVVMEPAGAMLCVWCDTPNAATPETVISQVTELLTKFAEKNSSVFPEKTDPVDPVDPVEPSASVDITLKVGDTSQEYQHKDKHLTAEDGDSKVADANVRYDDSTGGTETVPGDIITGSGEGVITYNGNFLTLDSSGHLENTTEIDKATVFSYSGNKISANSYHLRFAGGSFTTTNNYSQGTNWSLSNGQVKTNDGNRYIKYSNGWACSKGANNAASFRKITTKTPVTYVSFTGVAPGNTTYHVGDTAYNITVLKGSYTYPMTVTSGTTKALTPAPSVPTGCSVKYTVTKGSSLISVSNGIVTAANATGEATIVASVVNADNVEIAVYTYTVTVSDVDLEDKSIWINYFITNHHVADENGSTSIKINAGDGGIYSDKGVAITDLISITGTDTKTGKETKFYKAVAQSGGNIQTESGWTNKIAAGNVCMKLRYWNDTWSVCDANGTWHDVTGDTVGFDPTHLGDGMATSNDAAGYAAITAYYAQKTEVTDEITTYATDWGDDITKDSSLGGEYALLDFAVKYQSGDRVPTTFTNTKTIIYNSRGQADYKYSDDEGNTRIVKDLFVENTSGYEVYMITVTKCSSQLSTQAGSLKNLPTVTYAADNEKVVWVDKEEDLGDFNSANKQYTGYTVGGEPIVPAVYVADQYAYLVTYYVRSVSTSQLHVCYVDQKTGIQFHEYGINVIGDTVFDPDIKLNKDTSTSWKGNLENGTVKNDLNKDQTVSADLSTMPEIGAQYRYVDYTCVNVERSDDGKTVTLYYTFNAPVATFVADFGLPVTIEKSDINANLAANDVSITKIEASGVSCGKVSTDNNTVTYTPDSRFAASEKGDTFTLAYTGRIQTSDGIQEGSVAYRVTILPASNVLYEENFLKDADGWTKGDSAAPTTAQETQKAKETKNVFGYDDAYVANSGNSVTGELGVLKADGLSFSSMVGPVTTSFYGNGFDLIGNCGSDTGRVMVMFTKSGETTACKAVIVDTRFSDSKIAKNLYQVPWAHVELKEEALYDVEIYASGSKETASAATQSVRAYSYAANNDAFASVLASHGMSMADVEYVNAADTISTASSSIATYAAPATLQPGTHVEIDGFRVYRSSTATTGSVADNYPANEKNVTYNNILKVVKDQITAYTETNGEQTVSVENYEANGGPQKEIYLTSGRSVTFSVGSGTTAIQVSLRAVNGDAQWATNENATPATIKSNTEMYYEVKPNTDGSVTIANRGTTLLAIGNVKLPVGIATKSASEMDETAVYESVCAAFATSLPVDPEPDQTVFVPEHFSIRKYATPLFRHKLVTLRIDFSKDVSYVEIDRQKYYPSKFASWFGYYTVTFTDTIGRNDNYFYKVVFFDANDNPSETLSVYGK